MIPNELLTSSLKRDFDGREIGLISIGMAKQDRSYVLIVQDDGIRLDGSTGRGRTDSTGMSLVHALVSQLEGSMEQIPGRAPGSG